MCYFWLSNPEPSSQYYQISLEVPLFLKYQPASTCSRYKTPWPSIPISTSFHHTITTLHLFFKITSYFFLVEARCSQKFHRPEPQMFLMCSYCCSKKMWSRFPSIWAKISELFWNYSWACHASPFNPLPGIL